MRIGYGDYGYEWLDRWAQVPGSERERATQAHHGIVVTASDDIVLHHQADLAMQVLDQDGKVLRTWPTGLTGAHGMTLVRENGADYLWLAEGKRLSDDGSPAPQNGPFPPGRVVKMTLEGEVVQELAPPRLAVYREGRYAPTLVAVNADQEGGSGDIWVADGYGEHHVHRYDKAGEYQSSIDGTEGTGGRFDCPHGVWIDWRNADPALYIADRSNRQVQVYDLDGQFKRAFGADYLTSPSCFITYGEHLLVLELRARLTFLDRDDRLIGYLGENEAVCEIAGWPNVPHEHHQPGKFVAPHGVAADSTGNLFVAEWLKGGRVTKLVKS
ncbi:MAG: hypothetical protein CL878_00940 [Dehalococcoidia bacterium]|nr:hypothetical protein [Dehalococcoidia bacterium]